MNTFKELVHKKTVILDGATGTNLSKAGMPMGECTEKWVLAHPEVIQNLQKSYIEAGTEIVYAPTFQANAIKMEEYGEADKVLEMNKALVALTKAIADEDTLIAGDMTMTGKQLLPLGPISFEQLVSCYAEQAKALEEGGVDLFVVETMLSVQEARAAVLGIRQVSTLPVMVTLTFDENGRTLYGTDPLTALVTLQDLGIDAFGMNCSAGPEALLPHIQAMKPYAHIPLITKANAGLPEMVDGQAIFAMNPEIFAKRSADLVEAGASLVGGCCGTTPEHICELVAELNRRNLMQHPGKEFKAEITCPTVTTERRLYTFGSFEELEVDRRINAGANDELADDFADGMMDTLYDLIDEVLDEEADIVCIDIDSDKYDPCDIAEEVVQNLAQLNAPAMISTKDMALLEKYLRLYPGRALVEIKDGADEAKTRALINHYGAQIFE